MVAGGLLVALASAVAVADDRVDVTAAVADVASPHDVATLAQSGAPVFVLPPVRVVATSPLPGDGVPPDRVPANVRLVPASEVGQYLTVTVAGALEQRFGSVGRNDVQGNPFQPDLQYRGFTASPLLGAPQGIAVYQDGVRLNESFGDTVQWDLVPEFALDTVELLPGSNPVFGLNALGGAIALDMKSGFTWRGAEVEAYGGSFGRRVFTAQLGGVVPDVAGGALAGYVGGRALDEDGWRDFSPSRLRQLYASAGWRDAASELTLAITAADDALTGNGATPVGLLAIDRRRVFTHPDLTKNRLAQLALSGSRALATSLSVQGLAYWRQRDASTRNADAFDAAPCEDDPARLCLDDDGPPLVGPDGAPVASEVLTGFAGANNRTASDTTSFGGALQLVATADVLGRPNRLLIGASYDGGDVAFVSSTELGTLTPDRTVAGSGIDVSAGAEVRPVDLGVRNGFVGVYFSDTLEVVDGVALTVAGRYDDARIRLSDRRGDDLDGAHAFGRFNPAVGVTWAARPWLQPYAGYSESSRTPSAAELGCADPAAPCRLPNAFVADPPLEQVVAQTVEVGVRGHATLGMPQSWLDWTVAAFRTETDDDILFVASSGFGRGYFENAGETVRQGVEVDLVGGLPCVRWYASYAFLDATFQTPFDVASPSHPARDANGEIHVARGDRIPGLPRHELKAGVEWRPSPRWQVVANLVAFSDQVLRGDEANRDATVPAGWYANLGATFRPVDWLELFVRLENVTDNDFETFGTYGEPDAVPIAGVDDDDARVLGPGAPFAAFGGVRVLL